MEKLTPLEPHLLGGFYNWFVENNQTPYILVEPQLCINPPDQFRGHSSLNLNLKPGAVDYFKIDKDGIHVSMRFNKVPYNITISFGAIYMLYSKETGFMLQLRDLEENVEEPETPDIAIQRRKKFKLV